MRVLVINPSIPFPPVSGGDLRTYHLVRVLASRHEVTMVGFYSGTPFTPPPFPVRVVEVPWTVPPLWKDMQSSDPQVAQAAYEYLLNETDEPWLVSGAASVEMEEVLRQVTDSAVDLVLIEHTNMARFLRVLPPRLPTVLDLVDVHTRMAWREAERAGAGGELLRREAERTQRFESWAASQCTLCLAVSEPEAEAVRELLGVRHVHVAPNGVDTGRFTPGEGQETENTLLFTGIMNYAPNVEAVHYFVRDVLPLIQREIPCVTFHVVGAYPSPEVLDLVGPQVVVHGKVPDMAPHFRAASVVVVPLLHGGGTRLKILEAAACGKAMVTTSLGMEGLVFRDGEDLVTADTPGDFARVVVELLRDPGQRRQLGQRARQVAERYDWDQIGAELLEVIDRISHEGAGTKSSLARSAG